MHHRRQQQYAIQPFEYFLKPGFLIVNTEDTIVRTVLGNCVAVTMFDRYNNCGGINHFILPEAGRREPTTAQYGNVSIQALLKLLLRQGADRDKVQAQIFGGAHNVMIPDHGLGDKNIVIARKVLKKLGVPVISEDVGGLRARKLIYQTGTNETIVLKVDKIRRSDWVVPGQDISAVGCRL